MNCHTLFLAAAFLASAFGQPHCTVQEERHWRTLTAHFSIGSVTANVTLPTIVFRSDPPTVFLEVSGDGASDFRMETGGVNVPLRNGAALRPAPKVGERVLFTLTSGNGQLLCSWQPLFPRGWRPGRAPQRTDAFSRVDAGFLRKLGDPIALWVADDDAREFAIEGLPAMVLARGASEVILRDPRPRAGRRSVASKGYEIELRFIEVETRFSKPSSNGRATLSVRVPKIDLWGRHLWPLHSWETEGSTRATMTLLNYSGDTVSLLCGDAHVSTPLGMEADEYRQARITRNKIRDGEFLDTCSVRFKKQGTADIDITFYETPPYHRSGPASRRIPGIPFTRF
jgi:hypothetical protein